MNTLLLTGAFCIILMSCFAMLARAAGGGLFAPTLTEKLGSFGSQLPEFLWALGGLLPLSAVLPSMAWFVTLPILVGVYWLHYLSINTGHGNTLEKNADRDQGLTKVVDWLADKFKVSKTKSDGKMSKWYSRLFMGVKGFLIGVPLFPFGIFLAIAWPFSYEYFRNKDRHDLTEYVSGAFYGLSLALTMLLILL